MTIPPESAERAAMNIKFGATRAIARVVNFPGHAAHLPGLSI